MRKKIYVMQAGGKVKVGVSINPESRVSELQTGNHNEITLAYSTGFCDNAEVVESVCHAGLVGSHLALEWFDCDVNFAISVVADAYDVVGINNSDESCEISSVKKMQSFVMFTGCIESENGMYNINKFMAGVNKYRSSLGLSKAQIGNFFVTDKARSAIAESSIRRSVPLSMVKTSSRGKYGGTFVDSSVFEVFIKWASGIQTISIEDLKTKDIK